MRAMMSDHRTRAEASREWGNFLGFGYGEAALNEARAILAEVEPETRPTCEHPPMRVWNPKAGGKLLRARQVRHWQPRQDVAWEMRAALTEALAAWIEES